MLDVSRAIPLKGLTAVALTAVLFVLGGCGGEEPCADVDCEFGQCDSQSGECVNLESCKNDGDCVPGYACEEGACEALEECSNDEDCGTGVCGDDGVCVNPDSCEENDDCLDRTYCEEGSCQWDPCNDKACKRGVCERGTDRCVSADSCTEETARRDCVAGEKCADGTCEDEEDFCETLGCDRGECSFEEGGCADADECEEDDECLEGDFCNSQGRCQPDLCVDNEVECDDGGVCQPASGECENADPCESHDDCVDAPAHVCIDGACNLESTACGDDLGDGGCPGNQECDIDRDEQTAECLEPSPCETSVDCQGDRICAGRECIDPVECVDDSFEPNDSEDEATAFNDVAQGQRVRASLCRDDTDVYTFDSAEIIDASTRGELVVEANVPESARGRGSLELELTDEEGDTQTADTGPIGEEGSARITRSLSVDSHGDFNVEVSGDEELNEAGLEYDLSVNLLPDETVEACQDAPKLGTDARVSGDTANSDSVALGANCLPDAGDFSDVVYRVEVDAPQEVTFNLEPELSGADLAMSLRERCDQAATERDCVDARAEGGAESMTALLEEGTYYLIVQSGQTGNGGPFEVTTESVHTACGPGDDYCSDADTANLCSNLGGRFEEVECAEGCNTTTGACQPPEGDTCTDAPVLTPESDGGEYDLPQTEEVDLDLAEYNDTFQLDPSYSEDFCMDVSTAEETRTGGADAAYRVELPARTAVTGELSFADEVEGSLYVIEDCSQPSASCLAGAVDSKSAPNQEELTYSNFSDEEEVVYLIVDTAEGESASAATVDVTYEEVICEAGSRRCEGGGDVLQECESDGTAYSDVYSTGCGLGCETDSDCEDDDEDCEQAYCEGDECDSAVEIPTDGEWHEYDFNTGTFTDNYDIDGASCAGGSVDESPGPDAVFSVEAEEGDLIRTWWAAGEDPTVYLSSDCADYRDSCEYGDTIIRDDALPIEHQVEEDGTYYVFADFESAGAGGEATFGAQLLESCDPDSVSPTCNGDGVEACRPPGGLETLECSGSCTDGSCDDEQGDHCFDAKNITDDALTGYSDSIDWTEYSNDMNTPDVCGDVEGGDIGGQDVFYEIDMAEGDRLVADLGTDDDQANADPALILTGECLDPGSDCLDWDEQFSTSTAEVDYQADEDQTVYLIADNNHTTSDIEYDLNVDLLESCDPDTDTVQCNEDGSDLLMCNDAEDADEEETWEPYGCDGGCSDDACDQPRGAICEDAIPMEDGDSDERYYEDGYSNLDPSEADDPGECAFESGEGGQDREHIYSVDLKEGEELTASYGDGPSSEDGAYTSTVMYLMEDCTASETCIDNTGEGSSGSLTYTADEDETVYVVVDNDANYSSDSFSFELDIEVE